MSRSVSLGSRGERGGLVLLELQLCQSLHLRS
jgi:hypothetical protein